MAHAYCSWTGCYWTGSSYRLSPTRHRYFRNLFMLRSERSERSSSSYKKNVYNPIALGLYTLAEEKSRFDFNHNALRRQPQCLALATTILCRHMSTFSSSFFFFSSSVADKSHVHTRIAQSVVFKIIR